jgi:hypothetical protein
MKPRLGPESLAAPRETGGLVRAPRIQVHVQGKRRPNDMD